MSRCTCGEEFALDVQGSVLEVLARTIAAEVLELERPSPGTVKHEPQYLNITRISS